MKTILFFRPVTVARHVFINPEFRNSADQSSIDIVDEVDNSKNYNKLIKHSNEGSIPSTFMLSNNRQDFFSPVDLHRIDIDSVMNESMASTKISRFVKKYKI